MRINIFTKLLSILFLSISMVVGMFIFVAHSLNNDFINRVYDEVEFVLTENSTDFLLTHAEKNMEYLQGEIINYMYFSDADRILGEVTKFISDSSTDAIYVRDANGDLLAKMSKYEDKNELRIFEEADELLAIHNDAYIQIDKKIALAQRFFIYDEPVGSVIIVSNQEYYASEIGTSLEIIQSLSSMQRDKHLYQFAVVILLSTVLFLFCAGALLTRLLDPIRRLRQDINNFGEKTDNSAPFEDYPNDEIGDLAHSFKMMRDKVSKRENEIVRLAQFDPLTNLYNRNFLISHFESLITDTDCQVICLYMDLDNFKEINDTFGHDEGDLLIQEVAGHLAMLRIKEYDDPTLAKCFKECMTLSRLGGDEFVLLIQIDDMGIGAYSLGFQIAQQVTSLFRNKLLSYNVTSSMGLSLFPMDGNSVDELLKKADIAMYSAKAKGKGRFEFFNEEMSSALAREKTVEQLLIKALEEEGTPQFHMVYQPQYHLRSDKLVGVESLVRWVHPQQGFISPAEFIPIAERKGLIEKLGKVTVRLIMQDMKQWRQFGWALPVSWNLSTVELLKTDIVDFLIEQLNSADIPRDLFNIEITETALVTDLERAKTQIDMLRNNQFKVWLDDFGTGYSSLSILGEVEIDGLKIDRSFVSAIGEGETSKTLVVDALVQLTNTFDIYIVAEGIETQYQLDYLKATRCHFGQGYLYSKPVTADIILNQYTDQAAKLKSHAC
ncbi:putative bifunctional diguanylate cyclase/phosphodiesterase [Vibrio agarivorans]|uniref:putative bifunctional diguanylate cyclase/phosphodiesterase n=1 Tax=Vibrio agarivorans TaxID=153622 RepID=UPI0025B4BEC6|nr:EAL domain-containing protein [Vibrio agarivorans]MDN3660058.1 EAL domain-containing protein [Vibrio agarivorans]